MNASTAADPDEPARPGHDSLDDPDRPEPAGIFLVPPVGPEPAVEDPAVEDPTVESSADDDAPIPGPAAYIEELVAGAVAGDVAARNQLLAEIHPLVLRYCRGRLGRQETAVGSAADVAQDVCLAVVSALPTYTIKGLSFRAFVYGIAAHKVADAFRAIGRNRFDPVPDVPDTAFALDGPESRVLATELGERLGELLLQLTPRQREVLVLRMAVGFSAEETAQTVCSTSGAVRVTQHRALQRLRQIILEQQRAAGSNRPPVPNVRVG